MANRDYVFIQALQVDTTIGVYDWEKTITQTLFLDLEMGCDASMPGRSDKVSDAIDYKSVADSIIQFLDANQFELVEALAEAIAALLLLNPELHWVKIRVSKPGALHNAENVGVVIERTR